MCLTHLAKNLNDNDGDDDGQAAFNQNDNNPRPDYGLAGFNVVQTLVISTTYQLPFGRGQRFLGNDKWLRECIGWRVECKRDHHCTDRVPVYRYFQSRLLEFRIAIAETGSSVQWIWGKGSDGLVQPLTASVRPHWHKLLQTATPRFGDSGRDILIGPGLQELGSIPDETNKGQREVRRSVHCRGVQFIESSKF